MWVLDTPRADSSGFQKPVGLSTQKAIHTKTVGSFLSKQHINSHSLTRKDWLLPSRRPKSSFEGLLLKFYRRNPKRGVVSLRHCFR
ncbi:hypothetical protein K2173_018610 [Erythroxylum novogranatense]|uniref:Uncharacterized protein n=1 Tax=Erythroxylum novogranatense TaxID=1862640 RepID=A0AAV8UFP5_9ROSI|nr:hypothetical protein K2173_018610 [Erythroxylum novogranatense]